MEAEGEGKHAGGRFELHAALDPARVLGSWPRSTGDEVRAALAACARVGPEWNGVDVERRRAIALDAADRLERDREGVALLAALLGVEPPELASQTDALRDRVASRLDVSPASPGATLIVLDWTELLFGTAVAVLRTLVSGRVALFFADERVPVVADRTVLALEQAGLPAGALAVVHGACEDALATALAAPEVVAVTASGPAERMGQLRELAAEPDLELALHVPGHRTVRMEAGDDPAALAAEVVDAAFGRARTLSGQLPGRVGAVVCPPRRFSAFTEALLDALRRNDDVRHPVPSIDRDALEAVQAAWNLGLDEGATLIHGGELLRNAAAPTVFTNVEPAMELARNVVPGPLLRLLRAAEPETGEEG